MIRAGWRIRIARAVQDVFDFVADLRNEPQFNPDASNVQQQTPGPIGLGTVYTEDFRRIGRYETTIDRYERPSELGFDARNPRADALVRFRFAAVGEGETKVSCTVELRMKGATRIMEPLLAPMIRRQIERTRGPMLKRALEPQAAPGHG
ncbi:MAG: SRPBCC family protein [Gaiellales bacterium]